MNDISLNTKVKIELRTVETTKNELTGPRKIFKVLPTGPRKGFQSVADQLEGTKQAKEQKKESQANNFSTVSECRSRNKWMYKCEHKYITILKTAQIQERN